METCDRNGNCIDDMPTYAKEQLEYLGEKEKQMVTKVTNCGKCRCKGSCECNPGTVGCALALRRLAEIERRETVDHPDYYKRGGIEAIDAIEAWGLGFNLGNVVKYIARAGHKTKDSLRDLRKAAWYLDREIKRINSKAPYMVK